MTTLISWVGVDQRGPASVYLAADSRITWTGYGIWDSGRKLFAARTRPDLIGYAGDVLFPTQTLGQLVEFIDYGLLFGPTTSPLQRADILVEAIEQSLAAYPSQVTTPFEILYCTRQGEGVGCTFFAFRITFNHQKAGTLTRIEIPVSSGLLDVIGSGAAEFRVALRTWEGSEVGGTSRSVFSAFADALKMGKDSRTGGAPQIVGLYRTQAGRPFGVIWNNLRYFFGKEVNNSETQSPISWHNDLFEVCDHNSLSRAMGAQPQPRPRSLR